MENVGLVTADFFIHLCHLTTRAINYQVSVFCVTFLCFLIQFFQGPIGILLIITCLYYSIIYLEVSLANAVEILVEWLWPIIHITLRSVESFLQSATSFVRKIDEMGESMICDWAQLWCVQFGLMCHQRCSFMSKTLERFR